MGTLGIRGLETFWEQMEPRSGFKYSQVRGPATAALTCRVPFVLKTHEGKLFSLEAAGTLASRRVREDVGNQSS
eukprot:94688-Pyramimonas_sp.AAC.1